MAFLDAEVQYGSNSILWVKNTMEFCPEDCFRYQTNISDESMPFYADIVVGKIILVVIRFMFKLESFVKSNCLQRCPGFNSAQYFYRQCSIVARISASPNGLNKE